MRGSVFKRCQCRDENGRRIKGCRKPHGSWAFTVDGPRDPVTGKRKQIPRSGFKTRDEAEAARTKELAAVLAGTWTDDGGITVAGWLDTWLSDQEKRVAAGRMSVKTLANYRGHIRDVWKPRLGSLRLRDLRRSHVELILTDLSQPIPGDRPGNVGRRVAKRSAYTIANYRLTLRAALSAALRRGLMTVNPAEGRMDALVNLAPEDDELTIWQPEQTARFLEHVAGDRLSALYELAAYAGLRRAELCGLRWSDIDEDGAGLTVRQTIVEVTRSQVTAGQTYCRLCREDHVGRLFKSPKSRAGRRWVPLARPAQGALARHRTWQRKEQEFLGDDYRDHGLIFCDPIGVPLRPGTVTDAFEGHIRACGLPVIRLHDTRHGACSLLLAGGVPIEVVQVILGHSSPDVTRRVYLHIMRQETAAQVEAATELLTRHRRPLIG
jgi:integrase